MGACCSPSAAEHSRRPVDGATTQGRGASTRRETGAAPRPGMVRLPGGSFLMGGQDPDGHPADGEGPVRTVHLSPFDIDETAVTNDAFAAFVTATGHVTEAEHYGWSFVFGALVVGGGAHGSTRAVPGTPWWLAVPGASWRAPEGPDSDVEERGDHPVVHVSFNDAHAYAAWAGKRLPTEAEWEYAARGGLVGQRFPWGDDLRPGGQWRCNIWQGHFPTSNTLEDGHLGTAPVRTFLPNGFGLFQMAGNVWEWCSDRWSATWHATERDETRIDPQGPPIGGSQVMRGGSYLCHASYCNRYRVAARSKNTPDSSAGNLGFRCVR